MRRGSRGDAGGAAPGGSEDDDAAADMTMAPLGKEDTTSWGIYDEDLIGVYSEEEEDGVVKAG